MIKKWMVLIILSMSMFIIIIDTTIMNVSISALVKDLNTTVSGVQGAISLYSLVMASFILIGGKLGEVIGKKKTFLIGTALFGIGTFIAAISEDLTTLIVGWSIIEGIGGALMVPNISTLLKDEYKKGDVAFSFSIISATTAVGAAVGPIAGGYLTTFHSWRWAFLLEVVIVIIVLLLSGYIKTDILASIKPKFDFIGAILSILGLFSVVLGILLGQKYGFWLAKQPLVIGSLEIAPFGLSITPILVGLGIILLILLFKWENRREKKGKDGLFKPSLFNIPGLTPAYIVRGLQMAIVAAFIFTYPLLLQLTFEYTAIETGIALVPFSLAVLISAIVGARLAKRFAVKRIIQVGFLLVIIGLGIVVWTVTPDVQPSDLGLGVIFGIGYGLTSSQVVNLIFSSVNDKDTPEAAGLNGTFEQLGNSIGVALVGTVMLSSLIFGLQFSIAESEDIPQEYKAEINEALKTSVELVSNTQLKAELDKLGADPQLRAEVMEAYSLSRTEAFQIGLLFQMFLAIIGLISTTGLSGRKLIED
ncbi:MFS transporter [Methanolobus sp. ZRKC2]|uniref:MFS transporter n=1 Tax=Methanolobus sp. ZRKC2 TaxID=3125783 RepID=UPI003253AC08